MISEELLLQFGAEIRKVKKNELIFEMGHFPGFYYQIVEGKVKMNNFTEDGKEFIQNIFVEGQSFGEPPLFIDEPYPANAIAVTKGKILEISKTYFYEMLHQHPEVSLELNKSLARRLYYKSIMAPEISSQSPEKRIWTLLTYLKKREGVKGTEFLVDLSRQQLADLTGLRVETVIRTIKQLEKKEKLKIREGKIVLDF
ncbi:MAG TPA: Crp/Fnr family transcriptional regulator [Flavobacterium sp.]|nr:Crp/Fnr family transcriptional regulator [Flavobacterium sp.]